MASSWASLEPFITTKGVLSIEHLFIACQAKGRTQRSGLHKHGIATKHQLDATGSTIPEIHRDIIVLGACAYAMEAYQVPTNDNFEFQDGGLRDHVDDTHIPTAWAAAATNKMEQFLARLQEIKRQRDFAASARVQWGDVPLRWLRL